MKGYLTSYIGLFDAPDTDTGMPVIERVEVPLIQRDYAQGRRNAAVDEIRERFIDSLLDAVSGGPLLGLDFVYGRVKDRTLYPLDGQQRLTTLFLLHWYLASGAGCLDPDAAWTGLSYRTRPGARLFTQRLASSALPPDTDRPSTWIVDQSWYQYAWDDDPTIGSMLVVADAIHDQVARRDGFDLSVAWASLTDPVHPVVSFHLLPLQDMDSDEDLYVTMNSRGKPLTEFEAFKARFEQDIAHSARAAEFSKKVDGQWADLLWRYHGGDNNIDDEFARYVDFVTELCEFREGRVAAGLRGARARAVFGEGNDRAAEHLDLLFDAFDVWEDAEHVRDTFDTAFSLAVPGEDGYDPKRVVQFGASTSNLFEQCCRDFDSGATRNRAFTLQQSLLLYAVLLHRIHHTDDFPRRLRALRNLITASDDEIRRDRMPNLVADVEALIVSGDLDAVSAFNSSQIEEEKAKRVFVDANPDLAEVLERLEDHPILRGALRVFELDPATFEARARAFEAALDDRTGWVSLTGALLATGDYQWQPVRSTAWRFGTSSPKHDSTWRTLLTGATREHLSATRTVVTSFLDSLAGSNTAPKNHFSSVIHEWLSARERVGRFDWRYYLVKYPCMRSGDTGIYYGESGRLGYSLCMLRTRQLNGLYRDPILLGVWEESGVGDQVIDRWFTGYPETPRWLSLRRTETALRSVAEGFELTAPEAEEAAVAFSEVCSARGDVADRDGRVLMVIPQVEHEAEMVDTMDRVQVGAELLRQLVAAGL